VDRAQLEAFGIAPAYADAFGTWNHLDDDVARHMLAAMDVPADADGPTERAWPIVTRAGSAADAPPGELELEDGTTRRVDGRLSADLPLGYHRLHVDGGDDVDVIVSPGRCVPPPTRIWGWALQLYRLRSAGSWGIGDLGDLRAFGDWSRARGAEVVLVNPIDDVVPVTPRETSPYFPSSRRFRDPVYLRIEDLPGAELIADDLPGLAAEARSGDGERIDRDAVARAKQRALARLWWDKPDAGHEPGFAAYLAEQGRALTDHATFAALAETHGSGWRDWPARFRDPRGHAVADFAAEHGERIRFHGWVQWLLDEQLRAAGAACPLMRDLPIGVDPDGSDAWVWQDVLARDITVGAPPDELGPQGQDWLLPAFVPWKLRAAGYRPVIETLRSAFRHASALRIDHVLGLFRLFWIPPAGATAGTYVRMPADDLLDILALESHRAGAYVVGEDLGTVEPGVRDELGARDLLRYRVLWFEDDPPGAWDRGALASVTTHDLPTVAGLWSGADVAMQREVGLDVEEARFDRMRDKLAAWAGVSPDAAPADACVAAAALLGAAGCDVVVAQIEDAVAAEDRINVPGTNRDDRADNWSLPLPVTLEDLAEHATAGRVAAALDRGRRQAGTSRQSSDDAPGA
jgi:4-alpha-glucanotransferase